MGLITSEKKVTFGALRSVGGVVTKKKKVAKEDTDCFPYQDC